MRIKPASVTLIGWLLVVLAVVRAIFLDQGRQDPEVIKFVATTSHVPFSNLLAFGFLDVAVLLLSGICIQLGQNWARYLYVAWALIDVAVGYFYFSIPMHSTAIGSMVLSAVIIFFLFRPHSNAYFAHRFPPEI